MEQPKEDDGFGDFGDFDETPQAKEQEQEVTNDEGFGDFGDFEELKDIIEEAQDILDSARGEEKAQNLEVIEETKQS